MSGTMGMLIFSRNTSLNVHFTPHIIRTDEDTPYTPSTSARTIRPHWTPRTPTIG